jgi:ankyrin repeat protein
VRAADKGNLEAVRRLVQRDRGLLDANGDSWTPLTAAASSGHVGVIRYLLEEGAQLGLRDPDGWTALDVACYGHLGMVSLLLAHGVNAAAAKPGGGMTPLMTASACGHAIIVALLLAHGCGDIDTQDTCGLTALHHASCKEEHAAVVRALLGAGADPHVVDDDDETPLAMALRGAMWECVAELQVRLAKMSLCPS